MHSTAATRTHELVLGLSQTRRRDTLTLRQELIALLRRALPFDAWCWAFADPDSQLVSSGTGNSPAAADMGRFLALEYGGDDLDRLLTLADGDGQAIGVLSQITADVLCRSTRWRKPYHPHGTDVPSGPDTLILDVHNAIPATTPEGASETTSKRYLTNSAYTANANSSRAFSANACRRRTGCSPKPRGTAKLRPRFPSCEELVLRRVSKQLTCPRCGDVVANAVYQRWTGRLTITSIEGHQITPGDWAVQLQLVQQDMASASVGDLEEAQARLDFVRRNIGELIYDIRCRRGHSTLRTGPQIARVLRRTSGRWVSF